METEEGEETDGQSSGQRGLQAQVVFTHQWTDVSM